MREIWLPFYTCLRRNILTILKIKQLMIVEKVEKSEIKKIIAGESGKFHGNHLQETVTNNKTGAGDLKIIRKELQEILTILDKNGK
ncbi:MAG: hypothetical protein GY950_22815 [bacterium]|nr:hypothetical protein [bacterium]